MNIIPVHALLTKTMKERLMQMARLVIASILPAASSINLTALTKPSTLFCVQQSVTIIFSTTYPSSSTKPLYDASPSRLGIRVPQEQQKRRSARLSLSSWLHQQSVLLNFHTWLLDPTLKDGLKLLLISYKYKSTCNLSAFAHSPTALVCSPASRCRCSSE